MAKAKKTTESQESLESQLFKAADKLRNNIGADEYKHVVLGLIFLKHISDQFVVLHARLETEEFSNPEDPDEYLAENIFFVPEEARWSVIQTRAREDRIAIVENGTALEVNIGGYLDYVMDVIENQVGNDSLKGILPKVFGRNNLPIQTLTGLIDLISGLNLQSAEAQSKDLLGRIYEYFLGQFASSEGKRGGQFYTPQSIVGLLVEMLEPYKGRVYDPCCGSGGMFVMSEKFVESHQGRIGDIAIYGQESNHTTWRLCKMNLAIRGIDSSQVRWNAEGSFLNNAHPDVRMDYILANPPFNISDWWNASLEADARWVYGTPAPGNANFGWLQHIAYHLKPTGLAGVVLAKGSLTGKSSGEGEIRRRMIAEGNLIDCIVNLPGKLFFNTQIPAALWFINKNRQQGNHARKGEILFIDARHLGHLINRRNLEFNPEDIQKIAQTYHAWRTGEGEYEDIKGFCSSASLERVAEMDYVLTPGRYVGLQDEEDDFDFAERFAALKAEFESQLAEEASLNQAILENLARVQVP
ncbi:MAG: SAM-dependent DNA methyltransferase [Candidatus Sericytochromatia bacterium]|nr:SAM-dependent DNA methyltransferase [Candidatus Sericytochromatia bacterium]